MRSWFRLLLGCAALASVATHVSAVGPAQAPATGSRFIVRAVGPDGPIADLKREELSIKTDGKQREVKALELVTPASGAAAVAPGARPRRRHPVFRLRSPPMPRLLLLHKAGGSS